MSDKFGYDYTTIMDEDGNVYDLEILATLEYNGCSYIQVIPVQESHPDLDPYGTCVLKCIEDEDGVLLCNIDDPEELEQVEREFFLMLLEV